MLTMRTRISSTVTGVPGEVPGVLNPKKKGVRPLT